MNFSLRLDAAKNNSHNKFMKVNIVNPPSPEIVSFDKLEIGEAFVWLAGDDVAYSLKNCCRGIKCSDTFWLLPENGKFRQILSAPHPKAIRLRVTRIDLSIDCGSI